MINRKDAEAALVTLALARTLEEVGESEITGAYRGMMRAAHPDAGGTAEQVHALTEARAALEGWIKQRAYGGTGGPVTACATCAGSGIIQVRRGFAAPMRRTCPACRGTGDALYEHDNKSGGV